MGYNAFLTFFRNFSLSIVFILQFTITSYGEEVRIEFNGLDLIGNLEIAPGKSLESEPIILISHETQSSLSSPVVKHIQKTLSMQGYNTLAFTKSLGLNSRQGPFDCRVEQNHRHEDGVEEIRAWVTWLTQEKVKQIILFGYGRGASQSALYVYDQNKMIIEQKKLWKKKNRKKKKKRKFKSRQMGISHLILLSPLHLSTEAVYERYLATHNSDLGQHLAGAQKLVESGKGYSLIEGKVFLECSNARVTASSFLNYYLPKPHHSIFYLLEKLKLPTLAFVLSTDKAVGRYEDMISQQLLNRKGRLSVAKLGNFVDTDSDSISKSIGDFLEREK